MQQNDNIENKPEDHDVKEGYDYEANIKSIPIWKRLMYMIIFSIALSICRALVFVIAVLQFFSVLFTSNANKKLQNFGHSIGLYCSEIADFLTYFSEEKPFPFDRDWPIV
ncbi:DUF4389 domain-containing protein [Woeseiaceae bacterium]|nr:DUF4389 domain-containing protein [Woeseiaceae bacterium]